MVKLMSPAKANVMPPKHSSPPQNKYNMSGSPKTDNNGEKAKEIHKIYTLSDADRTPYGWAFLGFNDVKEWIKSMCNREGRTTTLGNKDFKPFTNLTMRWILHSTVADKLWVIKIDATMTELKEASQWELMLYLRIRLHGLSYPQTFSGRQVLLILPQLY